MAVPSTVAVATNQAELRTVLDQWRNAGATIALLPTMGALHDGHLAHVSQASTRADKVVVSIFVNPAQFAPHEDFGRYPRTFESDREKLERTGAVHLIYAPDAREMYPTGFATKVSLDGPAAGLETDFRPHFFAGVATVVTKLFVQCRPDIATFGEKDYQQLLVVRRLSRDLDLGVEVVGVPTVREADGLALSSRNAYLAADQRKVAAHLNRVLLDVGERARSGAPVAQAEAEGAAALIRAGFDRVDYVAIRDAETLVPLRAIDVPARVLAAARIGPIRLIDNRAVHRMA
jgi:pantoate--beta-alanine ligase